MVVVQYKVIGIASLIWDLTKSQILKSFSPKGQGLGKTSVLYLRLQGGSVLWWMNIYWIPAFALGAEDGAPVPTLWDGLLVGNLTVNVVTSKGNRQVLWKRKTNDEIKGDWERGSHLGRGLGKAVLSRGLSREGEAQGWVWPSIPGRGRSGRVFRTRRRASGWHEWGQSGRRWLAEVGGVLGPWWVMLPGGMDAAEE